MRSEFAKYQGAIIEDYHQKVKQSRMAQNLVHLKTTQIRQECLDVFDRRYQESEEDVLKGFFGQQKGKEEYRTAIEKFDVDRFRQIRALLKDEVAKTDQRNVELVAWLIDFQPRPFTKWQQGKSGEGDGPGPGPGWPGKTAWITIAISITFAAILIMTVLTRPVEPLLPKPGKIIKATGQCMYWKEDHYEVTACGQSHGDTLTLPLDSTQLLHQRRIHNPKASITYASIGHVWYHRTPDSLEYFTAGGAYPLDTNRRLLPITRFMIDHHILPKHAQTIDPISPDRRK
ncbi:hypothetical protein ACFGVR_14970 [Mucilaginibacter sp. AW1-3]